MENVKRLLLIDALNNFHQAFEKLASAWIESEADLSHGYPFEASFDEHAVDQWVKRSVALLEAQDGEFIGMGRKYKSKMFFNDKAANAFMELRPEFGVVGIDSEGVIHCALKTDDGEPTDQQVKFAILPPVNQIRKPMIQVSPGQILVDGQKVAGSFDDFAVYCSLKNLRTADFQNWPFSKQIV